MDLKSNEPFWLVKNGLLTSYPSLRADAACEVLIIGAGITGSLIAHQCIEEGYDTLLIDRREVCCGSSSATTSMLQYEIDTPLYRLKEMIGEQGALASYEACYRAIDRLKDITGKIRSKAGFTKKDSLYYAARKKDTAWLKKELTARKQAGYDVSWMEAPDILKKYDIHTSYGGILSRQGASVDAFCLAHELLRYNQKKGLQIYDKTALTGTEKKRSYLLGTTSTGAVIKAKRIVYCTGYESTAMIREHFVNLLSTFAVISERNETLYQAYKKVLIWNTAQPYLYMRTSDDGRFLIGGEDEEFRDAARRDRLLGRKEQKLVRAFGKLFPGKTFHADFTWAGTFGETKDGLPYISAHQDFPNAYFVLGFGGNGISFSVAGMEMVSYWLKGRKHLLTPYFAFGR